MRAIPVQEALPEEPGSYLTFLLYEGSNYKDGLWTTTSWLTSSRWAYTPTLTKVTHWMRLPRNPFAHPTEVNPECPNCGGFGVGLLSTERGQCAIICDMCCGLIGEYADTQEEAITRWNNPDWRQYVEETKIGKELEK